MTLTWISLERSFPLAQVEYKIMMPIFVKGDGARSGTKTKAYHGRLRAAQESMGQATEENK